jgi:hypothetical protein
MTGELIKSSPYQPAIFRYSNSSTLNSMYYENRANLIPFEKSKIRFINCYQNYIYASDLGRSIVFKTTLDGQTELAFGTFGKMPGQMNEPSGIHVDYDGKAVLVGDSKNNRLQVIFLILFYINHSAISKLFIVYLNKLRFLTTMANINVA